MTKSDTSVAAAADETPLAWFRRMVREAASDDGGSAQTPEIHVLASLLTGEDPSSSVPVPAKLLPGIGEYVAEDLANAAPTDVAVLLGFLARTGLVVAHPKVARALTVFVDRELDALSRTVADVAVFLARRGLTRARADAWMRSILKLSDSSPSWPAIDVIAELMPLASSSVTHAELERRLVKLSQIQPSFEREFLRRVDRWRRVGVSAPEILRRVKDAVAPNARRDLIGRIVASQKSGPSAVLETA